MTYYPPANKGTTVIVKDGQVDKALRQFKNKIQDQGLIQELRERESYEKPTAYRKRKKAAAKARLKKQLKTQKLPQKFY